MDTSFHAAKVVVASLGILQYLFYIGTVGQVVGLTDGVDVILFRGRHIEETASDAAVYFLVTFLVVAKTGFHSALDVVRAEENDTCMTFQTVVDADKVVEHTVGKLVAFIEHQQRVTKERNHADGVLQHIAEVGCVSRCAYLLGYLTHKV